MVNKIKDWIINYLGGYTEKEMREFKSDCSTWAYKFLKPRDDSAEVPFQTLQTRSNNDVYFIRDHTGIANSTINKIYIAPWCNNIYIGGCIHYNVNIDLK